MQDLLSHAWIRGHMRRAAAPHIRARTQTQGEVSAGMGMSVGGAASGGASCSGGGGGGGGGGSLGNITPLGGAAGSLSLPGMAGHGVNGSWGGARMQSSGGGISTKTALALSAGGLLAGGGCDGHNSSCPNITHAQFGVEEDTMDCSAPLPHAAGLSPLGRSAGSMGGAMMTAALAAGQRGEEEQQQRDEAMAIRG